MGGLPNEFYQITFLKKIYGDIETLQSDLDEWIHYYNNERVSGKDSLWQSTNGDIGGWKEVWKEKLVA